MLNAKLSDVARWVGGHLVGADVEVGAVSTDTRAAVGGTLFVALRGERHDAHDFVATARTTGAAAAMVERALAVDLPQVVVLDTQIALGELARATRLHHAARVVAITGSNGKTTVKTLLASILSGHARTHVSAGNFNNEIGLPLSVLAMPADCVFAVLEMGAGKPGDIDYLARIAQPDVGLVNNVAPAHLERMGSLDGIAETKGALYAALPPDGVAVINADDAYAGRFAQIAGSRHVLRFGLRERADVTARLVPEQPQAFTLVTPAGEIAVELRLPGRHNLLNALAASSAALALDVPLPVIAAGLRAANPVPGRHSPHRLAGGGVLIDDSYNANPGSFAAAIATLAAASGRRVLVMGEMRELGADAAILHAEVGALARDSGIESLHGVGALTRAAVDAFGAGAVHHAGQDALADALRGELAEGVTVLVKGSRGAAMDKVVRVLLGEAARGEHHAA